MFSIAPTLSAILACLIGLDAAVTGSGPPLSVWALAAFAVVPFGEISLLEAKRRVRRKKGDTGSLWFAILGVLPVAGFAAAMLLFGLPQVTFILGIEDWVLLDEMVLLAPYPAAAAIGRIYRHRRAAVFDPLRTWKRCRAEIILGFRGEIALLVPFCLFILAGDLIALDEDIIHAFQSRPALLYSYFLACLLMLATFFPLLLKLLWRLKPISDLYPGEAAIAAMTEGLNLRVRTIHFWNTGGLMVNAAILGFLPPFRYILITDAMLDRFTRKEIRAVIAHEVGHGRKKHILFFVFLSLAFAAFLAFGDSRLSRFDFYRDDLMIAAAFYLPAILIWIWFLFGFLSRRFEMEADVFAVRTLDNPALFIHTLDRLGRMNAKARRRGNWRHFSIDRRIALLRAFFPVAALPVAADPGSDTDSDTSSSNHTAPRRYDDDRPGEQQGSPALQQFEKRQRVLKIGALACSLVFFALFAADLIF